MSDAALEPRQVRGRYTVSAAERRATLGVVPETCHVCRKEHAKLSYEHTPPRAAFNNERTTVYGFEDWMRFSETGEWSGGRIEQRGAGGHVLCEDCNNKTGSWYGNELRVAANAGARLLREAPLAEFDTLLEHRWADVKFTQSAVGPHPLRFIKQVVTMLLATSPVELSLAHPELGDFVLDKERSGLPDIFRFYLSLFAGPIARSTGVAQHLQLDPPRMDTLVEVAFPPYAYVMTIDSEPEAVESADITAFTDLTYKNKADIELSLLIGFGHTIFPADYRTKAMVEKTIADNEAAARDT